MTRLRFATIVLCSAILLSACGRPPLNQPGLQGENTVTTVRDLTSAYERRDIEAFMAKISSDFPDRAAFQRSIEQVFAAYQTIHFKALFNRSLVNVEFHGPIKVTFTWEGEWQSSGGKVVTDGSRVTLVLDPGTFKVASIEGKSPFIPTEGPSPARQ